MSYTGNVIKITLLGELQGTDEIFSTSFHVGQNMGSISQENWDAYTPEVMEDIAAEAVALWSRESTRIPSAWLLTSLKFAYLDAQGVYLADAKEVEVTPTGGAGSLGWAPQLALVATMTSSKRKDPGKYNRMYFPTIISAIYGAPYLTVGDQENFATSVATFFTSVNLLLPTAGELEVSTSVVSAKGTGSTLPIENIRAGRVIDTQRRRRNKLVEEYVTRPVTSV